MDTVEVSVGHLEVSGPRRASRHDESVVLRLDLVDVVSDTDCMQHLDVSTPGTVRASETKGRNGP